MKNFKKIISILLAITIIVAFVGCGKNTSSNDSNEVSQNMSVNKDKPDLSFANMKIDNDSLGLTEEQKEVINYYDNNYFYLESSENIQRYPEIFQGAQVWLEGKIIKIIKETDKETQALVQIGTNDLTLEEFFPNESKNDMAVIKFKQKSKRIIQDDIVTIYGRCKSLDSYNIDSVSYQLPTINAFYVENSYDSDGRLKGRFSNETLERVAKAIFGENIKISSAENYYNSEKYYLQLSSGCVVTLDNQSTSDFDSFVMDKISGDISDLRNFDFESPNIYKLYVAADLEHYIVTCYEKNLKKMYINYYDRDLKKIWTREFSNVDSIPMDYTSDKITLVADNDMYVISTKDGKDMIEPAFVGNKVKVMMVEDGTLLIGKDKKDMFMKVDKNGNIEWKLNSKMDISDGQEYTIRLQIVDDNYVVTWYGVNKIESEEGYDIKSKDCYIVISDDGKVVLETE